MNNKFALSFGISLLIVGFLSLFLGTSKIVLFALSISTTIFSFINIIVLKINEKMTLLYILPFVILLSFFCFDDVLLKNEVINKIINSRIADVLTFLSFGFLFVSEYLNYRETIQDIRMNQRNLLINDYEYSTMIMVLSNEYMKQLVKKNKNIDEESQKYLDNIQELCIEKSRLADINFSLLELNKEQYSLEDFNIIYKQNFDTINYEKSIKKFNSRKRTAKNVANDNQEE